MNTPSATPTAVRHESQAVAVIVVHGIADQQPRESARAIAALLSSCNSATQVRYKTFEEDDIRIDVEPPQSADGNSETFYERAKTMSRRRSQVSSSPDRAAEEAADPGLAMMHEQILGYEPKGDDTAYRTVRLASERQNGAKGVTPVHVYEMYWADLSRLGAGLFRIFGELYQLLLHVPSLGRHAVDAASINDACRNRAWQRLIESQRWAAYFLTVPIPLLNLWMLGSVLVGLTGPLLVAQLPEAAQPLPAVIIIGLATMFLLAAVLPPHKLPFAVWAALPLLVVAADTALYLGLRAANSFRLTAIIAAIACGAAGWWIVGRYGRTQPFAQKFGSWSLLAAVAGLVAAILLATPDANGTMTAALQVTEVAYVAVNLAWAVFFVAQILAVVSGWLALREARADTTVSGDTAAWRQDRLARAERTAKLTLAIPAVSIIVLTLVLWAGLFNVLARLVDTTNYSPLVINHLVIDPVQRADLTNHSQAARQLLVIIAPELIVLFVLGGLAILLALWATLPAVMSEVRVPPDDRDPRPLGRWLDRGFRVLRSSGTIVIVACSLVMPLVAAHIALRLTPSMHDTLQKWSDALSSHSEDMLFALGSIIAGTAMSVVAFSGRLKRLTGGARPILDVLLDVDGYLREHPLDNNPRARIFARYIGLLRHVCTWRDAQGRPYQSVIVIAHSQGTVITTDLLRYLCHYPESSLQPLGTTLPVKLLTMGSPLRQLYGLRFPHFYEWARHLDGTPGATSAPHDIPSSRLPDPRGLNAQTWVNIYRSGDYVGRHLWRTDDIDSAWLIPNSAGANVSTDQAGVRREYCVGAGAHTHYWDGTAPLVAKALDELI
jgi:hypothetical protein